MKLPAGTQLKSAAYIINSHLRTTECADIYLARDTASGTLVIIHRLLDDYSGYADLFMEKARAIAAISHPAIASIIDIFTDGESACFVSQWNQGPSLAQITKQTPLTIDRAREIMTAVGQAINLLHEKGLPNLAVSPDNIFIDTSSSTPVIYGFSLPLPLFMDDTERDPYSAPERYSASGRNSTAHDIYSLGAVLYRCVTSQTPPANSLIEAHGLSYSPEIPANLAQIINKAMEPRALNRFFSAGEFAEALSHVKAPLPPPPPPAPAPAPAPPAPKPESIPEPIPEPKPEPQPTPDPEPEPNPTTPASKGKGRMFWAIAGLVTLGIAIGILYVLNPFGSDATTTVSEVKIPDQPTSTAVTDAEITVGPTKFKFTGTLNAEGLPQGEGTATYSGQWTSYTGNWENGQWQGHGKLTYSNGDYYEGDFNNNFFTNGKYFIDPNGSGKDAGSYFEGEFQNGAPFNGAWKDKSGKPFQKVAAGKTVN